MTRKEIKFVSDLSKEYDQIIEIGSGMSTLIWAKTFKSVIAIESRLEWYRKIDKILNQRSVANVNLLFAPPESCAFNNKGGEL
jgi:16S rRNA A1518/A1519 N6-dimethyltransferase RsmA/KsgA/DIM1 with predicted DNA glycosylase/AP lyase activity